MSKTSRSLQAWLAEGVWDNYTSIMPKGKKPKKPTQLPKEIREIFARFGSEGGKIGGKLRWKGVTPEERTAIARKAVEARWKKAKPKPDKP